MQQIFGRGGISVNKVFRSITSNQDVKVTLGSFWDFDEPVHSNQLKLKVT